MTEIENEQPDDRTDALAGMLGITAFDFARLFGANWSECPAPYAEPLGDAEEGATPWHLSGRPPILMLRIVADGVEVAVPHATWLDSGDVTYSPAHREHLAHGQLGSDRAGAVVYATRLRRKRAIRWCTVCHTPVPPESRVDDDLCMGCAERWFGVVF